MKTPEPTRYTLIPKHPGAHLFEVTCTVPEPDPQGQRLSLPAWIPGSYMIRDFARHVVRLSAHCDGRALAVEKVDKSTWRCAPCSGSLSVAYEVYAWDLSVRGAHLDTTHAYFNGTCVFLLPEGHRERPCSVDLRRPLGDAYRDWRVATAMPREEAPPYGFGTYRAADYDELADHPVEMGRFTLGSFEACGVPHAIAITGRHRADMARLTRDLKAICEHHIRFFGEPAPVDRYLFLVTAVDSGYGGLEHRASCSLLCSRDDLPTQGDAAVGEGYRGFLGLASHEYFHTWNVKRIRPAAFVPYDYAREVHTRLLWAFEGITSYYDDLSLSRTELIEPASYLELLGRTITRVWRGAGRHKQSLADSSFDAWTKLYKQDENAPNAIVSYYTKGALVALALDLTLRRSSGGGRSLDDVMRALWARHREGGEGVAEDEVERVAAEVAGGDLGDFFARYVHGTEDPPLADLLADVGVRLAMRPAESGGDKGGKPAEKPVEHLLRRGALGLRLAEQGEEARVAVVFDGSAAQQAGIAAGDVIVAVDGLRAGRGNLERLVGATPPEGRATVHLFRRDELMAFEVVLKAPPADTCVLTLAEQPGGEALARRKAWLGG